MTKKNRDEFSNDRASDPHETPGSEPRVVPVGAVDPGREAGDDEVLGEFLAATVRLFEVLNRRLEEAHREGATFTYHPGIEQEVDELKRSNEAIRKIVRLLESLKKAQNKRLDDLGWLLAQFGHGPRRRRMR